MRIDQYLILVFMAILVELLYQQYLLAILLSIFGIIFFLRSYFLAKDFKCKRCGKCCSLRVKPSAEEIKRIKKLGKKEKDFMDGKYLKRIGENHHCIFLKHKKGYTQCSIYKNRPETCKRWPNSRGIFGKQIDPRCSQFFKINKK